MWPKVLFKHMALITPRLFSHVAKLNFIHIIISLAANLDWPLHQLDVKNAFLHGDLNDIVYMAQPPEFESKGEYVSSQKVYLWPQTIFTCLV